MHKSLQSQLYFSPISYSLFFLSLCNLFVDNLFEDNSHIIISTILTIPSKAHSKTYLFKSVSYLLVGTGMVA